MPLPDNEKKVGSYPTYDEFKKRVRSALTKQGMDLTGWSDDELAQKYIADNPDAPAGNYPEAPSLKQAYELDLPGTNVREGVDLEKLGLEARRSPQGYSYLAKKGAPDTFQMQQQVAQQATAPVAAGIRVASGLAGKTPLTSATFGLGGEALAQTLEKNVGLRDDYNLKQLALQGVLNIAPPSRFLDAASTAGQVAKGGLYGMAQGAGGNALTNYFEGRAQDPTQLLIAGASGAALGGALNMRERPPVPEMPKPVKVAPGEYQGVLPIEGLNPRQTAQEVPEDIATAAMASKDQLPLFPQPNTRWQNVGGQQRIVAAPQYGSPRLVPKPAAPPEPTLADVLRDWHTSTLPQRPSPLDTISPQAYDPLSLNKARIVDTVDEVDALNTFLNKEGDIVKGTALGPQLDARLKGNLGSVSTAPRMTPEGPIYDAQVGNITPEPKAPPVVFRPAGGTESVDPKSLGLARASDPKASPGERPGRKTLKLGKIGDEKGEANFDLVLDATFGGVGAAVGAAASEDDPMAGALIGGLVGLSGGRGLRNLDKLGPNAKAWAEKLFKDTTESTQLSTIKGNQRQYEVAAPSRITTPRGAIPPERAQNINISRFPGDDQGALQDTVDRLVSSGKSELQRRGVQSRELTEELASHIPTRSDKPLKPGTALNAEQITALENSAMASTKARQQAEAHIKTLGANATDVDKLWLATVKAEEETLWLSLQGATAEAGRALQALSNVRKAVYYGDEKILRSVLGRLEPATRRRMISGFLAMMEDDPAKRMKKLSELQRPTDIRGWTALVASSVGSSALSGLQTLVKNQFNAIQLGLRNVVDPVRAVAAEGISKVTGRPSTESIRAYLPTADNRIPPYWAAIIDGTKRGFANMIEVFRTGMTKETQEHISGRTPFIAPEGSTMDLPHPEVNKMFNNPVGRAVGWAIDWPYRFLQGTDVFIRDIAKAQAESASAVTLAAAEAGKRGLSGKALDNFIAENYAYYLLNPDGKKKALERAVEVVGQEDPGYLANKLIEAKGKVPALGMFFMFIKTTANLARQGMEFVPGVGAVAHTIHRGGLGDDAQKADLIAKQVVGSMAMAGVSKLLMDGTIQLTGAEPANTSEAIKERSYQLPYSIGIKQSDGHMRWISYKDFGPVGVILGAVAAAQDGIKAGQKADDVAEGVQKSLKDLGRYFMDATYLGTMSELMELVSGSKSNSDATAGKRLWNYLARQARLLIPSMGAQRTIAEKVLDNKVRLTPDPKEVGISGVFRQNLPYFYKERRPVLDWMGNDVERQGNALRRAALPFEMYDAPNGFQKQILNTVGPEGILGNLPSLPDEIKRNGRTISLSADQKYRIRKDVSKKRTEAIKQLVKSDEFREMTKEQRAKAIRDAAKEATRKGHDEWKRYFSKENLDKSK